MAHLEWPFSITRGGLESIKTLISFPLTNVRLISLQILGIKDVSQLKQQKNMALLQEDLICWMMKHVWVLLIPRN